MKALTINIREEQAELLDELSRDGGEYESKSEAIRFFIDGYEDVERLRQENERLRREKRQILEQREEHTELVKYAREERSLAQERSQRRKAPAWRRAKWWLFGEPENSE